jgi:hypothetical protein
MMGGREGPVPRANQKHGGRSLNVVPATTARDGPHWVLQYKQGQRIVYTQKRFALGGIHNTIVDWCYNGRGPGHGGEAGAADAEEPVKPTPADSTRTNILPATDDPESDLGDF